MLTRSGDGDIVTELSGLTLDLDVVYEELFESGGVELSECKMWLKSEWSCCVERESRAYDLVISGLGEVDDEGRGGSLGDFLSGLGLIEGGGLVY